MDALHGSLALDALRGRLGRKLINVDHPNVRQIKCMLKSYVLQRTPCHVRSM